MTADGSARPHRPDGRELLWSFVGMSGMACVLFLVLFAGLITPNWVPFVLLGVWLVLFVLGTRWFMHHPRRVAVLPVLMLVIWVATIAAGVRFLNWTA